MQAPGFEREEERVELKKLICLVLLVFKLSTMSSAVFALPFQNIAPTLPTMQFSCWKPTLYCFFLSIFYHWLIDWLSDITGGSLSDYTQLPPEPRKALHYFFSSHAVVLPVKTHLMSKIHEEGRGRWCSKVQKLIQIPIAEKTFNRICVVVTLLVILSLDVCDITVLSWVEPSLQGVNASFSFACWHFLGYSCLMVGFFPAGFD